MASPKTSNTKGSLLIEICLAAAISSIALVAFASYQIAELSYAEKLSLKRQDLFSSMSDIEKVKTETDVSKLQSSAEHSIDDITPCLRRVASRKFSFELYLPDLKYAAGLDNDCGDLTLYPPNFSASTPTINSFTLDGPATALDALDSNIFVSTEKDLDSELTVLNKSEPIAIPSHINFLDATRSHVYTAANGPTKQFSVINIQNLGEPKLVTSISLPGVTGSFPNATAISYFNNKVYIGTHRTAGREFHVYDVSSEIPEWLGSLELNHNINSIYVREPYVFLATSGNIKDLIILDVSDPTLPKEVSSLNISGSEDVISMYGLGNTLYLGRKKSTVTDHFDFAIIDIYDPIQPKVIGGLALSRDISGIRVVDSRAFVSSTNKNFALTVVGITNKENPAILSTQSLPEGVKSLDNSGENLFLISDKLLSLKFLK